MDTEHDLSDLIGRQYTVTLNGVTGTAQLADINASGELTEIYFQPSLDLAEAIARAHESRPADPADSTFFVIEQG